MEGQRWVCEVGMELGMELGLLRVGGQASPGTPSHTQRGRQLPVGARMVTVSPSFASPSLQLQPARAALPLQHGAVQAVGAQERRGVPQLPAQHGGQALPLLQGGLLQGPQQGHHRQKGLQR